jgi:glyoxylase-like metal-dependent hydrolase (beta-lactamase superfamily II)
MNTDKKIKRYAFIARVPDEPGALHKAAEIMKRHGANINRVQFDRRIDLGTVFFEATSTGTAYRRICEELEAIGYLQSSLKALSLLRFSVFLPHQPGALFDFLNYTTSSGANIAFIDFDDKGKHPERVTMSLNVSDSATADMLLQQLTSKYRIEILEYDTTGKHLDDTVFYLRFAQNIRSLIGESEDEFLMQLLSDINHIVQELMNLGKDPHEVFDRVIRIGTTLRSTTGRGFYADIQRVPLNKTSQLICIQLPCGGNVFLIETPGETVMIDTGYGVYYPDLHALLTGAYPGAVRKLTRIVITHADADHCGASGFYPVPAIMHRGTQEIIREANRAYRSRNEASILEEVYTTLINRFSRFNPPPQIDLFPDGYLGREGIFPVISRLKVGPLDFTVLEGLGGHMYGQVYLLCREAGLLFAADTILNFKHLTPERSAYNSIAVFLVTSVNVDSDVARKERQALLEIVSGIDEEWKDRERLCLICGGHGPISVRSEDELVPFGQIEHYKG